MQSLNILIAGKGKFIPLILKSKFLNKLFITTDKNIEGAISIKFNTFRELAQKCKALKVDIVIVENERWILQGIADVLRKNMINCLALTVSADKLILSNDFTRNLLNKYNIATPKKLFYPNKYPVVVKADGICKTGYSLEEIIEIRNNIAKMSNELAKTIYLEEYIEGESILLTSLFDGKNLISFSQNELIIEYTDKLKKLLVEEAFNFIGFLNSKLIISNNIIYNIGFSSDFGEINTNFDFLYILNALIYQKLDEIK